MHQAFGAVCLGLVALCTTTVSAMAEDIEAFMQGPIRKVADQELAEQRGGFVLANGLMIRFAVDITHKVDSQVTRHVEAVLDQAFDNPQGALANVRSPKSVQTTLAAPLESDTSVLANSNTQTQPKTSTVQSIALASDPTSDPALIRNVLTSPVLIVNTQSNVHIEDITRVTVDVANYAAFAAQASQIQIGLETLNLVRGQIAAGLGMF